MKFTLAAQQRHKRYYDAKHVPVVFAVNDQVLLSTSGLNLKLAGTKKLWPKFVGPLKVLERIGDVAYKLQLTPTLRFHDVFHVSLLKRYHTDGRTPLPPPADIIDDELEWEVERILEHRLVKRGAILRLSISSLSMVMGVSITCGKMTLRTASRK